MMAISQAAIMTMTPLGAAAALCQLLLIGLVLETRLTLDAAARDQPAAARRALLRGDGGAAPLRKDQDSAMEKAVETIVADRVDAALAVMRGELDAARREGARSLANATEILGARVERLECDVDGLRSSRDRRRRRAQTTRPPSCDRTTFQNRTDDAMAACCPAATGGHRRFLQADCTLPGTCPSAACAASFIGYFDDCGTMLAQTGPAELAQLRGFYTSCQELSANMLLMLASAEPAMIFHVLVIDEGAAQAGGMFPAGGTGAAPPPPPLVPLKPGPAPPPPALPAPPPSPPTGLETAQEYRRVCTKANLVACAPVCDEMTYGFLLSIEIDGRGTVMTCNKYDGTFSWQGQASLGGYIGDDFGSFFSSVISGAAGTYMGTLTEDRDVHTGLTAQPGQVVLVSGDRALAAAPTWGSGGFHVGEAASLSLSYLRVDTAIQINDGALALSLDSCVLTFTAALVLRVVTATFPNQVFQGGVEVPDGASVSIVGSSLTFAASVSTAGLTVQSGGAVSVSSTTFATEGDAAALMVRVDDGGQFTVQGSMLLRADGTSDPFPCDGTLPDCAGEHAGSVVVDGPAVITLASPLVCDAATGECLSDLCLANGLACVNGACALHGSPTCVCIGGPAGNGRWTGPTCEVTPIQCCSTWCPQNGKGECAWRGFSGAQAGDGVGCTAAACGHCCNNFRGYANYCTTCQGPRCDTTC